MLCAGGTAGPNESRFGRRCRWGILEADVTDAHILPNSTITCTAALPLGITATFSWTRAGGMQTAWGPPSSAGLRFAAIAVATDPHRQTLVREGSFFT
jgi:hypothetical protein